MVSAVLFYGKLNSLVGTIDIEVGLGEIGGLMGRCGFFGIGGGGGVRGFGWMGVRWGGRACRYLFRLLKLI